MKAVIGLLAVLALPGISVAQPPPQQTVSPTQGQSPDQQARDETDCWSSAAQTSGFDPNAPPPVTTSPAPVTGSGSRAAGAAGGAIIGGAAGNAGAGAAAGAVAGGVARRHRNRKAAAQQNAAAAAAHQAGQASFYRARAACLTSRGYTVK